MSSLRNAVTLRLDDEVVRIYLPGDARFNQRANLIFESFPRLGEVGHDSVEDGRAAVLRGEHSLHVLHDEDGRLVSADDPQILPIEEVLLVALELLQRLAGASGATGERVGLAGRSAYQNPVVRSAESRLNAAVQILRVVLPEFEVARLLQRLSSGLGRVRMGEEGLAGDFPADMLVVAVRGLTLRKLSVERAQRQRLVSRRVLLRRHLQGEVGVAVDVQDRREAFSESAWAGEEVDYRDGSAFGHASSSLSFPSYK